jgi:copper homeostasis protein CutC
LGVERVLTKGGKYKSAIEGKESIKYYVNKYP